jgi:hypothetical protein
MPMLASSLSRALQRVELFKQCLQKQLKANLLAYTSEQHSLLIQQDFPLSAFQQGIHS